MNTSICLKNVSKSFGNKVILNHLNLSFSQANIYAFLGPSGCGKTTLLRILMGLEQADSGFVEGLEGLRKAAVFQEDRLCEELSVMANIRMVCTQEKKEAISMIESLLKEVGLDGVSRQPVKELSGGMKRRVSILRALVAPSDVLFFDEACQGLDAATRDVVMRMIASHIKGKTVFWITHDTRELSVFSSYQTVQFDVKSQPKLTK